MLRGRSATSLCPGIWKQSVDGPTMVRRRNIDGDGQGGLNGHGGEQRAVLVYQLESYRHWQQHFGRDGLSYGQVGENLTVDGLPDDEVCIGDRYRIGQAEFELTQPGVSCYRVGLRLGEPELPAFLVSHRRPGFYMRVIREGQVQAGDEIVRTTTGSDLSVADTDALLYLPGRDLAKLHRAVQIPALSPGWRQTFRELLAQGADTAVEPVWSGFRKLRVTEVVRETATVLSVHLADPDEGPLPYARAGQYLTLRISGAGEPAPARSYSLSSAPGAATYRISVKHEPHGVASTYLHRKLRAGSMLEVAAARGAFVLDDATTPVLLVSAGIGLTPVLSMLHQLADEDSERQVWWIHAARGPQEHVLGGEVKSLLASLPNGHGHVFYSSATEEECRRAHAISGRLTEDGLARLDVPGDASAYLCGPAPFMADMRNALTTLGVDPLRVHTELFTQLPSLNPGLSKQAHRSPHQPAGPPGTGPLLTFARSGLSTHWSRAWANVLDLADACDINTRWSCRTGVCHTCTTPLLSGTVSYQPAPLEPPPDGEALICCARPDTDVVLDM